LTGIPSIQEMSQRMNTPFTMIQAAVEAIAEQAGAVKEDFLNPWFIVRRKSG